VDGELVCNGVWDCRQGEDELGCPTPPRKTSKMSFVGHFLVTFYEDDVLSFLFRSRNLFAQGPNYQSLKLYVLNLCFLEWNSGSNIFELVVQVGLIHGKNHPEKA
jgi:hypothetical protein